MAYVTCQNGEVISVLDLDNGDLVAEWPLPEKPAGIALFEDEFVTISPDSKQVRRFDRASGTLLAETTLDGGPIGVALDPARGRLFVSDWYNARIWVLDSKNLTTLSELAVGAAPAGLALSGDGQLLASADRDADQVSIFDAATLKRQHTVDVGNRPFGLRFDPYGRLWVGNVGSNDVSVIDQGQVIATVDVGDRPYGVAFAQGRAFVSNQYDNTVSVIDLTGFDERARVDVGEYPEGIDDTADGRIVVANWFDNTVSVIDATTLEVLETIETGDGPRAFGEFVFGEDQ